MEYDLGEWPELASRVAGRTLKQMSGLRRDVPCSLALGREGDGAGVVEQAVVRSPLFRAIQSREVDDGTDVVPPVIDCGTLGCDACGAIPNR
jgi:hypothetical protein